MSKNPKKDKSPKKIVKKFQQLGKEAAVPEDLKKEVFSTLDTLNLFADIADLFTAKFTMTELEALGMVTEPDAPMDEKEQPNSALIQKEKENKDQSK